MRKLLITCFFLKFAGFSFGEAPTTTNVVDYLRDFDNEEAIESHFRAENCRELLLYANASSELSLKTVKYAFAIYPEQAESQIESLLKTLYSRKVTLVGVQHIANVNSGLLLAGRVDPNRERILNFLNRDFISKRMTAKNTELRYSAIVMLEMVFLSLASREELTQEEEEAVREFSLRLDKDEGGNLEVKKVLTLLLDGFNVKQVEARALAEDCSTLEGARLYAWLKLHHPKKAENLRESVRKDILSYSELYGF